LISGGTLADATGATSLHDALPICQGTVSANLSGAGTITAKSGTLLLSGTVSSGPTLTIDSAAAADLKFTGTATAASAISISNANQTLEIGGGRNTTSGAVESTTNG